MSRLTTSLQVAFFGVGLMAVGAAVSVLKTVKPGKRKKHIIQAQRRRRDRGFVSAARGCVDSVRVLWASVRSFNAPCLSVSSHCSGSVHYESMLDPDGVWRSFCPSCKRPLQAELVRAPRRLKPHAEVAGRYAYVVALWGSSPAYILGAMVLAKSLRLAAPARRSSSGPPPDLVLLYTPDVPQAAVELMARAGWIPRCVDKIWGARAMYGHNEPRFEAVFTKLHAVGLEEYEKVVLLDIDTLVVQNMDDLFQLPAPAALVRGPRHGYQHGEAVEGKFFFGGADKMKSWGQQSGINAGVMLLSPSRTEMDQMLLECADERHPSHIRGNGPEQDYLSRFWADRLTHIGVEYNFQLHQLYYVFHPDSIEDGERIKFLNDPPGSGLRLVHFSGYLKPWRRYLDAEWTEKEYEEGTKKFLNDSLESFPGYWIWVKQDPETVKAQAEREGIALGPDNKLHFIDWGKYYEQRKKWWNGAWSNGQHQREEQGSAASGVQQGDVSMESDAAEQAQEDATMAPESHAQEPEYPLGDVYEVPQWMLDNAVSLVKSSLEKWHDTYMALAAEMEFVDVLGENSLAGAVKKACEIRPKEQHWAWSSDDPEQSDTTAGATSSSSGAAASSPSADHASTAASPADQDKDGWSNYGGWWVERPLEAKASAMVGCVPEPFIVFSVDGQVLVELRGDGARGAHAFAVTGNSGAYKVDAKHDSQADREWAASVPQGAIMLVAVVGVSPTTASEWLATLAASACGLPAAGPPDECSVIVAVGHAHQGKWQNTMAAADFAMATLRTKSSGER